MEQLLKILEDNARLPIEDIATMLNKSPAEVAAMIDLARAQGIIKGYKTLVDWEKAGVNRVEAVIELNVSPKKSRGFDEIAATIASFDEVESVLLMSGGYDLQLVIKGQTFQEIALFVAKRLSPLDDGFLLYVNYEWLELYVFNLLQKSGFKTLCPLTAEF